MTGGQSLDSGRAGDTQGAYTDRIRPQGGLFPLTFRRLTGRCAGTDNAFYLGRGNTMGTRTVSKVLRIGLFGALSLTTTVGQACANHPAKSGDSGTYGGGGTYGQSGATNFGGGDSRAAVASNGSGPNVLNIVRAKQQDSGDARNFVVGVPAKAYGQYKIMDGL